MPVKYERASQPLTGDFVPSGIKAVFPAQYARFNELDELTDGLGEIRDNEFFSIAYNAAWTTLCMQMDKKTQQELASGLQSRLTQTPQVNRAEEINKYWNEFGQTSVYPIYQKTKAELNTNKYPALAVNTWRDRHKAIIGTSENVLKLVENIYANIYQYDLCHEASRSGQADQVNILALHEEVKKHAGEDVLGYVVALQLLTAGRRLSIRRINRMTDQLDQANKGVFVYKIPDPSASIKILLKHAEPYRHFAQALSGRIITKEKGLFGEKAKLAGNLWRAVTHLRYDHLPLSTTATTNKSFREPLVIMLAQGEYDNARYYIEDLMTQFPGVLPDFVANELNIDPTKLGKIYEETKAQENETNTPPSLRLQEREEREEAFKKLAPLINRPLISTDGQFTIQIHRMEADAGGKKVLIINSDRRSEIFEMVGRRPNNISLTPQNILALIDLFGFKPQTE